MYRDPLAGPIAATTQISVADWVDAVAVDLRDNTVLGHASPSKKHNYFVREETSADVAALE